MDWRGDGRVLLSLVAIPPPAGFAGKLLLFAAAIDAGFGRLAVVAILNTVVALALYLRILIVLYQTPLVVSVVALALTIGLGLAAQVLVGRIV